MRNDFAFHRLVRVGLDSALAFFISGLSWAGEQTLYARVHMHGCMHAEHERLQIHLTLTKLVQILLRGRGSLILDLLIRIQSCHVWQTGWDGTKRIGMDWTIRIRYHFSFRDTELVFNSFLAYLLCLHVCLSDRLLRRS